MLIERSGTLREWWAQGLTLRSARRWSFCYTENRRQQTANMPEEVCLGQQRTITQLEINSLKGETVRCSRSSLTYF